MHIRRGIFFATIVAIALSAFAHASPNLEQVELLMPISAQANVEATSALHTSIEAVNVQSDAFSVTANSEVETISRTTESAFELTNSASELTINLTEVGWQRAFNF
jgi:hypothetical protein